MSQPVKCFLLEPTDRAARWLRRFLSVDTGEDVRLCEPDGYHQATLRIEDAPLIRSDRSVSIDPLEWPADDPRWPARCNHCGYEFDDREVKQLFYLPIYRTPDGQEVTIHGSPPPGILPAPPGAMWFAGWYGDNWRGPDGRCLVVQTPGGYWVVDGPSKNGPGWTRTGEPPRVTVAPSVVIGGYHGWLRDGYLTEA